MTLKSRLHLTETSPNVAAVDVDVGSELIRVVVDGLPALQSNDPVEMLTELRANHDAFRRFVIDPPRGHDDVNACLLLPPSSNGAAGTIVVAPHIGYVPIAGTPLMAAATVLAALGRVDTDQDRVTVLIDTAKGVAKVDLTLENGHAAFARWYTQRPRILKEDMCLTKKRGHQISAAILSPGLPYVVTGAEALGIDMSDKAALAETGPMVIESAMQAAPLADFGLEDEAATYSAMIVGELSRVKGQLPKVQVAWVSRDGWVGPSPAGTGAITAATYLVTQGKLGSGEELCFIGPSGIPFHCQVDDGSALVGVPVRIVAYLSFPTQGVADLD